MGELTAKQLRIMQHALGLDGHGQGTWYRNHYVCGPGHDSFDDCRALVAAGTMIEHAPRELFGGDFCFVVTDAGKEAVRRESPPAPKLTRSQRRYRAFLAADSGLSFGEWMTQGGGRG